MRHERGFTLLEVMMAVAISATCLVGLMRLQTSAHQGNARARDLSMATSAAQWGMEEMAAMSNEMFDQHRTDSAWLADECWPDAGQNMAGIVPTHLIRRHRISTPTIVNGVYTWTLTVTIQWNPENIGNCTWDDTANPNKHQVVLTMQRTS